MDGVEERLPVGSFRSTSSAERVKKERIVLESDSGPRPEARKEDKGKKKVAEVRPKFAGAVGKQDTQRQIAPRGVGTDDKKSPAKVKIEEEEEEEEKEEEVGS